MSGTSGDGIDTSLDNSDGAKKCEIIGDGPELNNLKNEAIKLNLQKKLFLAFHLKHDFVYMGLHFFFFGVFGRSADGLLVDRFIS